MSDQQAAPDGWEVIQTSASAEPPKPQSWSDWALDKFADWLPAIAGTGGGIAGTVAGGPGGGLAGATLGAGAGEAYKELINKARGKPTPTTPMQAAETIASKGVWTGAVPEVTGQAAGAALRTVAPMVMQSAVKPTLAAAKRATGGTPQLVQTLLDEGIAVTKSGQAKLANLIAASNDAIKDAISQSTAEINPFKVTSRLTDVAKRVGQQVNPASDLEAVSQVGQEFLEQHGGAAIPVQQAQAVKVGTYRELAKKYGEVGSASTEAQKALARGLKEEIANEVPDVTALNAREGKLLQAFDVVGRRVALKGNLDPIGFAWVTHNPWTFLLAQMDRSPAVKSYIARGMWNAAGTITNTSPALIRAAVMAIAQSPDEMPKAASPSQ